NHASIIDGCRLSRAEVAVVRHGEADAFAAALAAHRRARRRWLVTESYFSMDGDSPDLARLRAIADEHQAGLVVDEAHALGVLGPEGRGACAAAGVAPDIFIGTLGKALGLAGAFVAGPQVLRSYLWNRARSFVFSTGVSPVIAAAVAERVARCRADDAGRERLASLGRELRATFPEGSLGASHGPILPWIIGDEEEALAHGRALAQAGILVVPIRPPTVPRGTSRLRITLHAKLSDDELRLAAEAFAARRC
ncbi:MAG: aminotransferase class I/II-fold pyridoxal phosphate-dependent enzyme, partial [Myxococcales bacterium]|nr:aminotransferase class I/II-fold pyridoxal phosphate-dependent enzyme [Myxococcales bacterium]